MRNILKIDPVMGSVPVVPGHPDIQAQVRAELEEKPLNLLVGSLLFFWRTIFQVLIMLLGNRDRADLRVVGFRLAAVLLLIVFQLNRIFGGIFYGTGNSRNLLCKFSFECDG